jgi:hypothetical protein
VAVLAGHAEQVGQHPRRQLGGHRGHQVDLAGQAVEDVSGVGLYRQAQPVERLVGRTVTERPAHREVSDHLSEDTGNI